MKAVSYLGGQLSNNATLVADIYTQATQKPHSYLFCDVTQQASAETQYLSHIFGVFKIFECSSQLFSFAMVFFVCELKLMKSLI